LIKKHKIRNVSFILLGIALFILKQKYNGPNNEIVKSYLGNFSISFVVYFIIEIYDGFWKANKLLTAFITLVIVSSFELTNGFGVMKNVYDTLDLFANIIGVLLALALDIVAYKFTLVNKP